MKNLKLIVLTIATLTFFLSTDSMAAIPAEERAALIALYNSTNGDNWRNNSGWKGYNPESDGFSQIGSEGSWVGVTASDYVTELNFFCNQLSGNIPPELGNLSNLSSLRLMDEQLIGSIPPELGNLSKLEILDFSKNGLSGSIPPELGNLTNLHNLDLSGNQLSGGIPPELGNIFCLLHLFLSGNQLSGSIPPELGNLTCLLVFDLSDNQLSGSIPPELGNANNLYNLYLNDNFLNGPVPTSITDFVSLGDGACNFCENNLYTDNGTVREFLNQKQTGGDWESCQNVTPPTVTTTTPSSITPISASSGGNVTSDGYVPVTARGVCWSLSPDPNTSDTCSNDGTGLGEYTSSITGLAPNTDYHVRAYATNIVGTAYGSNIPFKTGVAIPTEERAALIALYNTTDGDNWTNNSGWKGNNPEPDGFSQIGAEDSWYGVTASDHVSKLELNSNNLSGSIPPDLEYLFNLETLTLSSNRLIGNIPSELENLSNLISLSLSINQITGGIPPELGNLSNLQCLYLNDNLLIGAVPLEISNLVGLMDGCVNICNNYLCTDDAVVRYFLNQKLIGGDWENCQREIIPAVTTTSPYPRTPNSVSAGGVITSYCSGSIPSRGVCWSESSNPTMIDSCKVDGQGNRGFTSTITGLSAGTAYHVRAYAVGSKGTVFYGNDISFRTMAAIPAIERAALIALYNATDGDNWTNNFGWKGNNPEPDGFSQIGSEDSWYGVTASDHVYTLSINENGLAGSIPPGLGNFSSLETLYLSHNQLSGSIPPELGNLSNLQCLYLNDNDFFGAVPTGIINIVSLLDGCVDFCNNYLYADDAAVREFLNQKHGGAEWENCQKKTPPSVTTTPASAITSNSALVGGNVTSDGGAFVTAKGVCWNTLDNPPTNGSCTNDGVGEGPFTSTITGLTANTVYHFTAYATNSEGTSYGNNDTIFLQKPTVTTTTPSSITPNSALSSGSVT
ncbi:MAG: hypothetical protein GY869_20030, partial [Planctomycetes bacterium]|nr:hypothetical protein [Planctomycetota bacterium]